MGRRDGLTKGLAIVGTVLVWLTIILPLLLALGPLLKAGRLLVDYLLPAEIAPVPIIGGVLILWAAVRAHLRRTLVAAAMGVALISLIGSMALAAATGLASGETQPTGAAWALVLGSYALYPLALVVVGVGGALVLTDLFRSRGAAEVIG